MENAMHLEDPWHVLHVIANHEKKAATHLAARSVEYFLPLYKEDSRWSDRSVILERPLFPGYVFLRFEPRARNSVITIPGALKLLGKNGTETIDGAEVERIREGLKNGYVLKPHPCLAAGTRVRVCRGIFEGVEGVVTEMRRNVSVVIALSGDRQFYSLEAAIRDIEVLGKTIGPNPGMRS